MSVCKYLLYKKINLGFVVSTKKQHMQPANSRWLMRAVKTATVNTAPVSAVTTEPHFCPSYSTVTGTLM